MGDGRGGIDGERKAREKDGGGWGDGGCCGAAAWALAFEVYLFC
jgi:hypothetical protein